MSAVLIAVAGQPGAGKSRLAMAVATRLSARLVQVAGDLETLPDASDYSAAMASAKRALGANETVVVVGPFHTRVSRRELMRVASDTRSALLYVECSANESVRRRRLRKRILAHGGEELPAPELDRWLTRLLAQEGGFERIGAEIPRAAQMLVETTVGVDIWSGLAASRVETWFATAPPVAAPRRDTQDEQVAVR